MNHTRVFSPRPAFSRLRRRERPTGLTIALVISGMMAVGGAMLAPAIALQPLAGRRIAAPLVLLMMAAPGAAVAYGLVRERPWTRPLLVAWCAAPVVIALGLLPFSPPQEIGTVIFGNGLLLALVWWYLYRRPAVAEYYASLSSSA